jgi:hypothetical protein
MLIQILLHTPSWVWLALAAALWRGYVLTRPRQLARSRLALLPALFATLSVVGVVSSFGVQAGALLCWAGGLALSAYETQRRGAPAGAAYIAQRRSYDLPGSWVPLLLVLLIFGVKYTIGVQLALHPALRGNDVLALIASAVYGALSGVFIGRALGLWQLQRRAPRLALPVLG